MRDVAARRRRPRFSAAQKIRLWAEPRRARARRRQRAGAASSLPDRAPRAGGFPAATLSPGSPSIPAAPLGGKFRRSPRGPKLSRGGSDARA